MFFYIFGEQPTIRIYSPEAARGFGKSVSACVSMCQHASAGRDFDVGQDLVKGQRTFGFLWVNMA